MNLPLRPTITLAGRTMPAMLSSSPAGRVGEPPPAAASLPVGGAIHPVAHASEVPHA